MDKAQQQREHEAAAQRISQSKALTNEEIARRFGERKREQQAARIAEAQQAAAEDKTAPRRAPADLVANRVYKGQPPKPPAEPTRCGECGSFDHPQCPHHRVELRPISWARDGEPLDRRCPETNCYILESKLVQAGRGAALYERDQIRAAIKRAVARGGK